MIIPDVNLLIYAYNRTAPLHRDAREWWEELMNGTELIGLPWAVIIGYIRLMTHRSVQTEPMRPSQAFAQVNSWLKRPHVHVLEPGQKHLAILESLLQDLGVAGNLTMDAHLGALTIEYQAELHSNDNDFSRFTGLRWRNPLNP